jgi:hypothetical protein
MKKHAIVSHTPRAAHQATKNTDEPLHALVASRSNQRCCIQVHVYGGSDQQFSLTTLYTDPHCVLSFLIVSLFSKGFVTIPNMRNRTKDLLLYSLEMLVAYELPRNRGKLLNSVDSYVRCILHCVSPQHVRNEAEN